MNPDSVVEYPKNQYKKFIKDVVTGTLERSDLIKEKINTYLENDINLNPITEKPESVLLNDKGIRLIVCSWILLTTLIGFLT